jgi:hypothetical protein
LDPYHFERKLKADAIPEWDGDQETLLQWVRQINYISERSDVIFDDVGEVAPLRLKGRAKQWFQALPEVVRRQVQTNWYTLKTAIVNHFMNRTYLELLKLKALRAKYRQKGHEDETPSDFFYRKLELLQLTHQLTEPETVMEIMKSAPLYWENFIDITGIYTIYDLQNSIKAHEDSLMRAPDTFDLNKRLKAIESKISSGNRYNSRTNQITNKISGKFDRKGKGGFKPKRRFGRKPSRANAIGQHPDIKPKYPRDDSVRSAKKTPQDVGARPCRHCGSPLHWDYECKRPKAGERKARALLAEADESYDQAFSEYQDAYIQSLDDEYEEATTQNVEAEEKEESSDQSESENSESCTEETTSDEDF